MASRYRCKSCGRSFKTGKALSQHMRSKHPGRYYAPRVGVPVAVVVVAALLVVFFSPSLTAGTSHTTVISATTAETKTTVVEDYRRAPDFRLPVIDELGLTGEEAGLSDFEGRPVFLEFMSPTCPHCKNMVPTLKKLYEKYGDEVVFLTVMLAFDDENSVKLNQEYLQQYGTKWLHVLDKGLKVFRLYGVEGTPTFFVLDSQHRVVSKIVGEKPLEVIQKEIEKVL